MDSYLDRSIIKLRKWTNTHDAKKDVALDTNQPYYQYIFQIPNDCSEHNKLGQ